MSKRTFTKLVWKEVSYPRPFDEEKICEILSHIAVVTPRGPVILEARSHGGYVKHFIGGKYISYARLLYKFLRRDLVYFYEFVAPVPDLFGIFGVYFEFAVKKLFQ